MTTSSMYSPKTIGLSDSGIDKAESYFKLENLYDIEKRSFDSLYR